MVTSPALFSVDADNPRSLRLSSASRYQSQKGSAALATLAAALKARMNRTNTATYSLDPLMTLVLGGI